METNNKIRAALEQAKEIARTIYSTSETGSPHEDLAERIVELAHAALAEPPRNCDVGSVDDQKDRFLEFCDDEKGPREHCRNCRLCNSSDCELAWAQLPYEEGGVR